MKIVVILPTYNEKGNIGTLIEKIEKEIAKLKNNTFDLLVVDDSSPDGTAAEVRKWQKKFSNLHLILNKEKVGLGRAIILGMDYAIQKLGAEILLQMDADLSHDPAKIPEFLKRIDGGADFVIGSRYIENGAIPKNWGLHRKIFSKAGNLIVRSILGIFWVHEWTSGFRAIKRKFFENTRDELLKFNGYTFQVAFLHKSIKKGARIAEVPIIFSERYYGRSKLAPVEYITNLLRYLIIARLQDLWQAGFLKYCVIGTLSFIITALVLELFYRSGLAPGPAAAIGTEIAIIFNFICNNFWTFSQKRIFGPGRITAKFIQFNFTSTGAVLIQGIVVGLGTFLFGDSLRTLFLAISTVFFIIPYNWFMYSKVIWKTNAKKA